jgi:hypothetical protein
MSLEFTLVRRAISLAVIDGPDADDNPDILQAQGSVLFEPVINKGDSIQVQTRGRLETYALAPIECPINDGIISHRGQDGVKLPAGGEATNPSLIRWKATFSRMQAGGKSFTLAPVIFDAVPGGEIDLTMVAPVAGTPEGIVRGPRGTSLESIIVDGSELVFTAVDDGGSFELVRIPLDDVVRAEADAAAAVAAAAAVDGVEAVLAATVDEAKGYADRVGTAEQVGVWADEASGAADAAAQSETNAGEYAQAADGHANRAEAAVDTAADTAAAAAAADTAVALREEMKPVTQANAAYMGQSLVAFNMATESANAAKASEDKAKSWAELAEVSGTSALARLDSIRAWFRGEGPPPAEIPGARVGDWWLDTTTMELHEITEV